MTPLLLGAGSVLLLIGGLICALVWVQRASAVNRERLPELQDELHVQEELTASAANAKPVSVDDYWLRHDGRER